MYWAGRHIRRSVKERKGLPCDNCRQTLQDPAFKLSLRAFTLPADTEEFQGSMLPSRVKKLSSDFSKEQQLKKLCVFVEQR